ncbi:MAG: cytochrome P450, partial [Gammaproteobacteria bacterium]|nr:cytochrome P450 [Gammaproteobacteria bacterium]
MQASDIEKKLLPPGPDEAFDLHTTEESFFRVADLLTKYGDICQIASPTRRSSSYLINHPDYVKHVLVKNNTNYTKGVGFERVKLLLGNGIIVSDGPFWRRQRRMIQPAFNRQIIASLIDDMAQCNFKLRDEWREKARTGKIINITDTASELALRIVLRSIFGDDLQRMEEDSGGNPFAILTDDSARDMQLVLKYRGLRKLVQAVIERRREAGIERNDFLSAFMLGRDKETGEAMTDRELIDEVMTL